MTDGDARDRDRDSRGRRRGLYGRLAHWRGILGLAVQQLVAKAIGEKSGRLWFSIGGVALAVALMIIVTGIGLGLAADSTIQSNSVDYWILQADAASSTVVGTGRPAFGNAHAHTDRLRTLNGVNDATPVLVQVIQMRAPTTDAPQYVLALGIIPTENTGPIAGVDPMKDPSGDPFFANGTYNGAWTGDVVLSPAAANLLNASAGTQLRVFSTNPRVAANSLQVTHVGAESSSPGHRQLPVALFRLSELQALTGADEGDQADQFMVDTNTPRVKAALQQRYPDATVVPRSGITAEQVLDAELPLAMSLTTIVIATGVGLLFVATTMGLEITAARHTLAVLGAVGYPPFDRAAVMVIQMVGLTVGGGILGVGLGYTGILAVNVGATAVLDVNRVAMFHPLLGGAGIAVALAIGILASPYLYVLTARTNVLTEITR